MTTQREQLEARMRIIREMIIEEEVHLMAAELDDQRQEAQAVRRELDLLRQQLRLLKKRYAALFHNLF